MLEYGSVTGLPGKYRITLAISVALLLHTLVMAVLPFTAPQTEGHRQTVRVELLNPGSEPSPDTPASPVAQARESSLTQPDADSNGPQSSSQPDVIALDSARNSTDTRETTPDAPQPVPEERDPERASSKSAPSRESSATAAGNPEADADEEPESITRITDSPREMDPYTASLAAHVGKELDKRPVPSSRRVTEPVSMELELRLLGSGALTSARVSQSTGFSEIDQAVYQAALLASPYPEPPKEHSGRKRFRVELIFAPERF